MEAFVKKFLELSSWSRKAAIESMLIVAMLFAACGDEDSSFAPRDNTVSDSDIVAESFDNLPVCSSMREGAAAYVKDEKTAYICTGGSWVPEEETSSSSSETTQSSSSITTATPCNVDGVNNCVTDSRDGKTYRTVNIGSQWWMAENLNYETDNSFCYNDSAEYCEKYGRLYTWVAAMDSAGTWSTNGKGCGYVTICSPTYPVRGVCPEGWHLPTRTEWETLFKAVGGQSVAGTKLKSTSGWNSNGNGTDAFSFSALPAGGRYNVGNYDNEGNYASFWSSTVYDSYLAYYMFLHYNYDFPRLVNYDKNLGFSVRCVKD